MPKKQPKQTHTGARSEWPLSKVKSPCSLPLLCKAQLIIWKPDRNQWIIKQHRVPNHSREEAKGSRSEKRISDLLYRTSKRAETRSVTKTIGLSIPRIS